MNSVTRIVAVYPTCAVNSVTCIVAVYPTCELLRDVCCCAAQVAIGRDPRVSGPLLGPAVLTGLVAAGAQAVDVGLATTPAMFYGIVADGM
jgi:phosphomannomutase